MLTVPEVTSDPCIFAPNRLLVHSFNNTFEMTISLSRVFVPCSALSSLFYAYPLHGFGPRNWIL